MFANKPSAASISNTVVAVKFLLVLKEPSVNLSQIILYISITDCAFLIYILKAVFINSTNLKNFTVNCNVLDFFSSMF